MDTKTCPHCKTTINKSATRCPNCTKTTIALDPTAMCLIVGIFGVLMGVIIKAFGG